jgi:GNAT superfamily N-acetyltransferase
MNELPDGYELVADQSAIDADAAHAYLSRSYWAKGIPVATVRRALANSLCVAIRHLGQQVAMARVVTDCATFAYLADVYVIEDHRGLGLSRVMLAHLHEHPQLQGLRRWMLMTRDAQGLYRQFGWKALANPAYAMELHDPEVYG